MRGRDPSVRDRGSMAVEVVVLLPVLLLVAVLVVAFGRYVTAEGAVQAAAREAARAATLERDGVAAQTAADRAAAASLPDSITCSGVALSGAFAPGETLTATVACEVPWDSLGLIGLSGSASVSAASSAPLDPYRRTGP